MGVAVYAACFDASALAKRYLDEPGSAELRQYWRVQPTRYTTPFCLYETLGILKRRVAKKPEYLAATNDLVVWFRAAHTRIADLDFLGRDVFPEALKLSERTGLDLSDTFQLLSLRDGYFSGLVGDSATLLVTADEALAQAARNMRLRVWDCMREPIPGWYEGAGPETDD